MDEPPIILTPEQEAQMFSGLPLPEEKHNKHTFLNNIAKSDDTTKTGNLGEAELGFTRYSERSYKDMELAASDLCDDGLWADYFKKKAEILTATSLSKDAILIKLAASEKREIDATTKVPRKENKSWFKSKDDTIQT
jgi:hypothetical protein